MRKGMVGIVLAAILVGFGAYMWPKGTLPLSGGVIDVSLKATAATASLIHLNEKREIISESESNVFEGDSVETDRTGEIDLNFSDGSNVSVGPDTTIRFVPNASDSDKTIRILDVGRGRFWADIVRLTSSGSRWEVRSSNVTATVRGTSFGILRDGVRVYFFVVEGEVAVAIVDPRTGRPVPFGSVILTRETMVSIDTEKLPTREAPLRVLPLDTKAFGDDWISARAGVSQEKRFDLPIPGAGSPSRDASPSTLPPQSTEQGVTSMGTETEASPSLQVMSDVKPNGAAKKITEVFLTTRENADLSKTLPFGTVVNFSAMIKYSDGTVQKIAPGPSLSWLADVEIGTVNDRGTFKAREDIGTAAAAESLGFLRVFYDDSQSGIIYRQSVQIRVGSVETEPAAGSATLFNNTFAPRELLR